VKLTHERKKCCKRYYDDVEVRRQVNIEFAYFSDVREGLANVDS